MKKTQKRVFGFFGLVLVAAMTFLAAITPTPGASATTASVEDTLVIKVINEDGNPHVKITSPTNGLVTYADSVDFTIDYNSTDKSFLDVTYIGQNSDGTDKEPVVITDYATFDLDYHAGTDTVPISLLGHGEQEFGYGKFIFSLRNIGIAGVEVPGEQISIMYSPISVDVNSDEEKDGSVNANVGFETETDPETGKTVPTTVGKIEIVVRYSDGIIVYGPKYYDPKELIDKDGNIKDINIPFGDFANKTDTYQISVTAYGKDGNYLYTITKDRYYVVTPVPDTGMFFQELNISKEDYLISGLIVFFIFAVVGFAIVSKNHKKSNTRK